MSYQVTFSLWLLTFETNIAEEINKYVWEIPEAHLPISLLFYQKIRCNTEAHGRCPERGKGEGDSGRCCYFPGGFT